MVSLEAPFYTPPVELTKPDEENDEVLIPDPRAELSPSESVEKQLVAALRERPCMASYFRSQAFRGR